MELTNDANAVQAVTAGVLWGVDRVTFRDIIVASAAARRARFDGALAAMPIFSGLTPEQRAAIAVRPPLHSIEFAFIWKTVSSLHSIEFSLAGKQCQPCREASCEKVRCVSGPAQCKWEWWQHVATLHRQGLDLTFAEQR